MLAVVHQYKVELAAFRHSFVQLRPRWGHAHDGIDGFAAVIAHGLHLQSPLDGLAPAEQLAAAVLHVTGAEKITEALVAVRAHAGLRGAEHAVIRQRRQHMRLFLRGHGAVKDVAAADDHQSAGGRSVAVKISVMKKRLEHRFAAAGAEEHAASSAAGGFDGSDGGYGRRGMPRLGDRAVDVEEDGAVIVHGGFLPSFLVQFFPYYIGCFVAGGAPAGATRGNGNRTDVAAGIPDITI